MSFFGNTSTGSSSAVRQTIEESRRHRENRRLQRVREQSALLIQSVYRSYRSRISSRQLFRLEWDDRIRTCIACADSKRKYQLLLSQTRECLYFCDVIYSSGDISRVQLLCKQIPAVIKGQSKEEILSGVHIWQALFRFLSYLFVISHNQLYFPVKVGDEVLEGDIPSFFTYGYACSNIRNKKLELGMTDTSRVLTRYQAYTLPFNTYFSTFERFRPKDVDKVSFLLSGMYFICQHVLPALSVAISEQQKLVFQYLYNGQLSKRSVLNVSIRGVQSVLPASFISSDKLVGCNGPQRSPFLDTMAYLHRYPAPQLKQVPVSPVSFHRPQFSLMEGLLYTMTGQTPYDTEKSLVVLSDDSVLQMSSHVRTSMMMLYAIHNQAFQYICKHNLVPCILAHTRAFSFAPQQLHRVASQEMPVDMLGGNIDLWKTFFTVLELKESDKFDFGVYNNTIQTQKVLQTLHGELDVDMRNVYASSMTRLEQLETNTSTVARKPKYTCTNLPTTVSQHMQNAVAYSTYLMQPSRQSMMSNLAYFAAQSQTLSGLLSLSFILNHAYTVSGMYNQPMDAIAKKNVTGQSSRRIQQVLIPDNEVYNFTDIPVLPCIPSGVRSVDEDVQSSLVDLGVERDEPVTSHTTRQQSVTKPLQNNTTCKEHDIMQTVILMHQPELECMEDSLVQPILSNYHTVQLPRLNSDMPMFSIDAAVLYACITCIHDRKSLLYVFNNMIRLLNTAELTEVPFLLLFTLQNHKHVHSIVLPLVLETHLGVFLWLKVRMHPQVDTILFGIYKNIPLELVHCIVCIAYVSNQQDTSQYNPFLSTFTPEQLSLLVLVVKHVCIYTIYLKPGIVQDSHIYQCISLYSRLRSLYTRRKIACYVPVNPMLKDSALTYSRSDVYDMSASGLFRAGAVTLNDFLVLRVAELQSAPLFVMNYGTLLTCSNGAVVSHAETSHQTQEPNHSEDRVSENHVRLLDYNNNVGDLWWIWCNETSTKDHLINIMTDIGSPVSSSNTSTTHTPNTKKQSLGVVIPGVYNTKDSTNVSENTGVMNIQKNYTLLSKISILLPFITPVEIRMNALEACIQKDQASLQQQHIHLQRGTGLQLQVRRQYFQYDVVRQVCASAMAMRGRLLVMFVDHQGVLERGVDGGGQSLELHNILFSHFIQGGESEVVLPTVTHVSNTHIEVEVAPQAPLPIFNISEENTLQFRLFPSIATAQLRGTLPRIQAVVRNFEQDGGNVESDFQLYRGCNTLQSAISVYSVPTAMYTPDPSLVQYVSKDQRVYVEFKEETAPSASSIQQFTSLVHEYQQPSGSVRANFEEYHSTDKYGNPYSAHDLFALQCAYVCGIFVGRGIYFGNTVPVTFGTATLRLMLYEKLEFEDLLNYDKTLYAGLCFLQGLTKDEDITNLALTFSYNQTCSHREYIYTLKRTEQPGTLLPCKHANCSHTVSIELVPNGNNIPVTIHNRNIYIQYLLRFLEGALLPLARSMKHGIQTVLKSEWLRLFEIDEASRQISGTTAIPLKEWRAHTNYIGIYSDTHPVIEWFWQVVEELSPQDLAAVLTFSTGSARMPIRGFGSLDPKFAIQEQYIKYDELAASLGVSVNKIPVAALPLPTSSTCFHVLRLPNYPSKAVQKQKLQYAINAGAGFDLS